MPYFKSRVMRKEPVVGTFCGIVNASAVELTSTCGFDFLCIDAEHSPIDRAAAEGMIRAADVRGVPAIVRVPGLNAEAIASVLDSGAKGVLVPRVGTAEQALAAVKATRYPPYGERGVGPGRAAAYGASIGEYLGKAHDELLLAIQIETAEGLQNIEEIAAVEGIDVIFIGPGDLSVSLNAMGPENAARLNQAITTIIEVSERAGKVTGMFRMSADDVNDWRGFGVSFFVVASDTMFLAAGAQATVNAFKARLGEGK
ncbi:aldolase/citrate lyase family protein [Pseudomonas silvicola]|nr:aldolase/citrate lyase family protein [Pseudomonas silvicola]